MNERKNLVLITIECFRADHMHLLGYSKEITSNLDRLAKRGMTFAKAMATAPWTVPSISSLLTSTFPPMYGGYLSPGHRLTLAEILEANGYKSGAFVDGWLLLLLGYRKGFNVFRSNFDAKRGIEFGINKIRSNVRKFFKSHLLEVWSQFENADDAIRAFYDHIANRRFFHRSRNLTNKALSWLSTVRDSKFFLWIHYPDSHEPYYTFPKGMDASLLEIWNVNQKVMRGINCRRPYELNLSQDEIELLTDLYDISIKYVDNEIGFLMENVERMGLFQNTIFVITGDHGQQFMEHGDFGHPPYLYDELLNVPLIMFGLEIPQHSMEKGLVSLLDVAPTALELLDIKSPSQFIGKNILEHTRKFVIAEVFLERADMVKAINTMKGELRADYAKRKTAYRTDEFKYIYNVRGRNELYRLKVDPQEQENVIDSEPVIGKKLSERIREHIRFEATSDTVAEKRRIRKRIRELKRYI